LETGYSWRFHEGGTTCLEVVTSPIGRYHAIHQNRRKVSWFGQLLLSWKSASALRSTATCPPSS